jgi:hypothetical protein
MRNGIQKIRIECFMITNSCLFFVYYTMTIIVEIPQEIYTVSVPVEKPDVEQFMYAIETAIIRSGFSERGIEDYILEWAAEIKNKRDGKS